MYNEQLEQLIDAALADGVLTEKEKQILFKKAQSLGIDLDEFEMVLDARLVELEKTEKEKVAQSAPKSNKIGDVKKCPACGTIVQSYLGICPECGYAFEGVEANSLVRKLSNDLKNKDYKKMSKIINQFTIPTTKGDVIELMNYLQTILEGIDLEKDYRFNGVLGKSCVSKLHECSRKAKMMFPNDQLLNTAIKNLDEAIHRQNKLTASQNRKMFLKKSIKVIIGIVLILASLAIGYVVVQTEWSVLWKTITIMIASVTLLSYGIMMVLADDKDLDDD